MNNKLPGYTIYDLLLFQFPEQKDFVCADVMIDEDYKKLSEEDQNQVKKIIMYVWSYPQAGRRPHVPEDVDYIFRKYFGG